MGAPYTGADELKSQIRALETQLLSAGTEQGRAIREEIAALKKQLGQLMMLQGAFN